ncbi:MAG: hemerythrin domain-containing protein [Gammaproteobacteria bacterium]|nr:hemerythrin domain-containing protein [Gammaproteobacteria bacterium]
MTMISDHLTAVHGRCDELLARGESAVSAGRWEDADGAFDAFRSVTEAHIELEEQTLFPRIEPALGTTGPTQVMRGEHDRMRALMRAMGDALGSRDEQRFLDAAETLLVLMRQHNAKEEAILYPIMDDLVAEEEAAALLAGAPSRRATGA